MLILLLQKPKENKLKNLYIQFRDDKGTRGQGDKGTRGQGDKGRISCPRSSFIRWIDSIELKSAIEDGYKAKIICGINFPESVKVDS